MITQHSALTKKALLTQIKTTTPPNYWAGLTCKPKVNNTSKGIRMTTYFMIKVYWKNSYGDKCYFSSEFGPYLKKSHATQVMIDMDLNLLLCHHRHNKLFYEIVEICNSFEGHLQVQVHDTKIAFIRREK